MKLRTILSVVLASLVLFSMAAVARADGLKPFVLARNRSRLTWNRLSLR